MPGRRAAAASMAPAHPRRSGSASTSTPAEHARRPSTSDAAGRPAQSVAGGPGNRRATKPGPPSATAGPSTSPAMPAPGTSSTHPASGRSRPRSRAAVTSAVASTCPRGLVERAPRGAAPPSRRSHSARHRSRPAGPPRGQRAGLVEDQHPYPGQRLQRAAALHQHAGPRAARQPGDDARPARARISGQGVATTSTASARRGSPGHGPGAAAHKPGSGRGSRAPSGRPAGPSAPGWPAPARPAGRCRRRCSRRRSRSASRSKASPALVLPDSTAAPAGTRTGIASPVRAAVSSTAGPSRRRAVHRHHLALADQHPVAGHAGPRAAPPPARPAPCRVARARHAGEQRRHLAPRPLPARNPRGTVPPANISATTAAGQRLAQQQRPAHGQGGEHVEPDIPPSSGPGRCRAAAPAAPGRWRRRTARARRPGQATAPAARAPARACRAGQQARSGDRRHRGASSSAVTAARSARRQRHGLRLLVARGHVDMDEVALRAGAVVLACGRARSRSGSRSRRARRSAARGDAVGEGDGGEVAALGLHHQADLRTFSGRASVAEQPGSPAGSAPRRCRTRNSR